MKLAKSKQYNVVCCACCCMRLFAMPKNSCQGTVVLIPV